MFGEGTKTTFNSLCVPAAPYPRPGTAGVAAARSHVQLYSLADRMFGEGTKTTFNSLCVPAAPYPGPGTTGVAAARSHVQLHSLADRWPKQPGLHPVPGRL
jgi:hypothetical protein